MGSSSVRARGVVGAAVVGAALLLGAGRSPGDAPASADPLLTFSTLLGGSASERGAVMGLAPDGALWVVGLSSSLDFPGAERPTGEGESEGIVVLRFDPESRSILSHLWLEYGEPDALVFDSGGNAFLSGQALAGRFPHTAGTPVPTVPDPEAPGSHIDHNAFVVKIAAGGTQVHWSAQVGGSGDERPQGLAVTPEGDPVVVGRTTSDDFPLASPMQPGRGGSDDVFVTRILADGSGFVFSTFLGGQGHESAGFITLLPSGGFLLGGTTESADFPATDRLLGAPLPREGFLVEIDAAGTGIARGALLGDTYAWGGLVESASDLLLWGTTVDPAFPAAPAPHGPPGESSDVFLLRLDAADWGFLGAALYGGSGHEHPRSVARGPDGTIWLGGEAPRPVDLPVPGGARVLPSSGSDAYLAAFAGADLSLLYGTYLGGEEYDTGNAVVVTADGAAWLAGQTALEGFPLVDSIQPALPVDPPHAFSDLYLSRHLRGDPATRPAAPLNPAIEVLDGNSARLTWEDASTDETCFAVYRRVDAPLPGEPGTEPTGFARVAVLPAGTVEWVDEGLTSDRRASWAVQAINGSGGSAPTEVVEADLPSTLAVSVDAGSFRLRRRQASVLRIRGTLSRTSPAATDPLDPREAGLEWRFLQGGFGTVFRIEQGVRTETLPALDGRWRGATRWIRWKDRNLRFDFRPDTGAFRLRLKANDRTLESGRPVPMQFTLGADSGPAEEIWFLVGPDRMEIL